MKIVNTTEQEVLRLCVVARSLTYIKTNCKRDRSYFRSLFFDYS